MKTAMYCMVTAALSIFLLTANAQTEQWDYKKNSTVDSISEKYKDKQVSTAFTISEEKIYPVIGLYFNQQEADINDTNVSIEHPTSEINQVKITLDTQNKGVIWIDGLPQGKIKAHLMKSPTTYKIPVQKNEKNETVEEGTLIYDETNKELHLIIGEKFNMENPTEVFKTTSEEAAINKPTTEKAKNTKTEKKIFHYIGTKLISQEEMVPTEENPSNSNNH